MLGYNVKTAVTFNRLANSVAQLIRELFPRNIPRYTLFLELRPMYNVSYKV